MSYSEILWGSEIRSKGLDGMSNAAIETFKSSSLIDGFVRELIQNSLDARKDDNEILEIKLRYFEVKCDEVPAFQSHWIPIFKKVKLKWGHSHKRFFEDCGEVLSPGFIPILEYADFNTKGLSGSDKDDESSFSACVLSEGTSVAKTSDAGGSYGIGKNAVYGISKIRTVLYSSMNLDNEFIFQGVSKLASYELNGVKYDSRIYLGQGENKFSSIREFDKIPDRFKRFQVGLSQFILFPDFSENWIEEVIHSVIRNYFLLLNFDGIRLSISDSRTQNKTVELNKSNFIEIAEKSFNESLNNESVTKQAVKDHVYLKIKALEEDPIKGNFNGSTKTIKDAFTLHLYSDIEYGYNSITYTRRGMSIFNERLNGAGGISYLNLIGVFYSTNREINSVLRMMEPATHDSWKKEKFNERISENEKVQWGISLLDEIKKFIRDESKKLIKKGSPIPYSIKEVDQLISGGNSFSGKGGRSGEIDPDTERPTKTNEPYKVDLVFSGSGSNRVEGEFIESGTGSRDDLPKVGSIRNGPRQAGKSTSKRGRDKSILDYKIILVKETQVVRTYKLIIYSDSPISVNLTICQVGDRSSLFCPELLSLRRGDDLVDFRLGDIGALADGIKLTVPSSELFFDVKSLTKSGFVLKINQ